MPQNCELTANYQELRHAKRPKHAHHGDYTPFYLLWRNLTILPWSTLAATRGISLGKCFNGMAETTEYPKKGFSPGYSMSMQPYAPTSSSLCTAMASRRLLRSWVFNGKGRFDLELTASCGGISGIFLSIYQTLRRKGRELPSVPAIWGRRTFSSSWASSSLAGISSQSVQPRGPLFRRSLPIMLRNVWKLHPWHSGGTAGSGPRTPTRCSISGPDLH